VSATGSVNQTYKQPPLLLAAHPDNGQWLSHSLISDNAWELIAAIRDSRRHGFSPKRYNLDQLLTAIDKVQNPRKSPTANRHTELMQNRQTLTDLLDTVFLQLLGDHASGIVNPRMVQSNYYREVPTYNTKALLDAVTVGKITVNAALQKVTQQHTDYRRLTVYMQQLLLEKAADTSRTVVAATGKKSAGDHHDVVMNIKRRLMQTGELPASTVLTPMFDAPLVLAVQAFQKRHGLPETGVVASRTRRALNMTLDQQIERLSLSLERWRWMPREFGERHVFVNLPSYRLQLINGKQRIIDMPVVIGAVDHPTPSFSEEMSYLEISPTWTVPAKITREELLPLEIRQPGYLQSRGFDYFRWSKGKLVKVPHANVSPVDLLEEPFPYMLRQRAGSGNALGKMKFMMPNPYAIYLHDTQARQLFSHRTRAYSHGCVRLSDPERLASLVLQIDGKSHAEAEQLMSLKDTTRVPLDSPVPTHLAYFTTWVDAAGKLQTRPDVYRHDAALQRALLAPDT
jgi:murein L,D-transpeptidase YcbB/YkuD